MAHKRHTTRDDDALNEDGASDTPLHRLPGFGTGLHRQRVPFVRAGEAPPAKGSPLAGSLPGGDVSDLYLSIVMGETKKTKNTVQKTIETVEVAATTSTSALAAPACDICSLPLTTASSAAAHHHETCLVHQVALDHSKPPSALDRGRFGLAIMSAQGWDPDSGRGLGADQQGMAYPIEVKLRPDRQALGNDPAPSSSSSSKRPSGTVASAPAPSRNRKYTRKQLRAMEEDRRRRHDRLREQIMGNKDLDKYLRPQGDE
ncbi:hypothetical protein Sste5346_007168 [Sporothrix stenoceras]|uniref:G-patch domain-containing protein n=1 Tax=Sporothrix stenoceras TaxID=5173 RepID=A0ABR3YWD8_9PEZI